MANTKTFDYEAAFEEFDKETAKKKTGWCAAAHENHIQMYTKRSGNRERVFCVIWYERNSKFPTKKAWEREARIRCNGGYYTPGAEWVEKRRTFPYTPEGLKAADEFEVSDELMKLTEEWRNR